MLILKEEWQNHPKILKAVFLAKSPTVKHFWFELLSSSANAGTDGVIEVYRVPLVAQSCGIDPSTADTYLRALIDCQVRTGGAGLWHDAASLRRCAPCKEALKEVGIKPGPDDLVAHDFLEHNPAARDKTPLGRLRQKRKNWLARSGKTLKLDIYRRDRGLCRYCGRRPMEGVDGPEQLWYDHIDPSPQLPNCGNTLDNLVTACKGCNGRKGQRTPTEAGMRLLAIGVTALDVDEGRAVWATTAAEVAPATVVRPGSDRAQARLRPGSGPARRRDGAGAPAPRSEEAKSTQKGRSGRVTPRKARSP